LKVDAGTAVAVLSHDPKIDIPAIRAALASPAFYVGALGSRRTHEKRVAALSEAGVSAQAIARVHAPIGLDIGSREPQEIALAILAEIIEVRRKI
jgi:xanthine dehydrogenase accessory factor